MTGVQTCALPIYTLSHVQLTKLSEDGIDNQLQGWQDAVDKALGYHYNATWFRPPGGAGFSGHTCHKNYCDIIAKHGMVTAMWSVETIYALYKPTGPRAAGENPTASDVARYVLSHSGEGSIILLHFGSMDIHALGPIIDGLRARGLELVTLTELVNSVKLPT